MSADQVEKLSRKQLTISEYITSKQIKSLFSRWSRLLREGKLKEPSEKEVDDVISEEDENDDDAEQYHNHIQEQVAEVLLQCYMLVQR